MTLETRATWFARLLHQYLVHFVIFAAWPLINTGRAPDGPEVPHATGERPLEGMLRIRDLAGGSLRPEEGEARSQMAPSSAFPWTTLASGLTGQDLMLPSFSSSLLTPRLTSSLDSFCKGEL